MQSTNQSLTERELQYATRRFKYNRSLAKGPWQTYLLFTLIGLPLLFVENDTITFWFGIGLMVFGVIGAFFFRRYNQQTTVEILSTRQIHCGKLTQRMISAGQYSHNRLFLDDYLLETPDGLEYFIWDLVDKYDHRKIEVQLAVYEERRGEKLHTYYTPLKIENDFCIDSAIKNHGTGFLKKATYQLFFDIMMVMLIFTFFMMTTFYVLDFFNFESTILFMILLFPCFFYAHKLYTKLVPRKILDIKEKLKCTCS